MGIRPRSKACIRECRSKNCCKDCVESAICSRRKTTPCCHEYAILAAASRDAMAILREQTKGI